MEPTSVLIGIPHKDRQCDALFITGLFATAFSLAEAGIQVGLRQSFGGPLDLARNKMVKYMLEETKATHLFFLDHDVLPPPQGVIKLLKDGLEIVSGLYQEHHAPHRPIIIDSPQNQEGKHGFAFRYTTADQVPVDQLVYCDVVPAGCLLVERRVFEELKPPWFATQHNVGEDVYFSLTAREAGYQIAVDTGVECLHVVSHLAGSKEAIEKWGRDFGFEISEAPGI